MAGAPRPRVTKRPWRRGWGSGRARATQYRISGNSMTALIAILVFVAAIFVLNVIEFGRPD
jgi:hypothetical protein